MVLKKLITFIYSLIGVRLEARTNKEAIVSYVVLKPNIVKKVKESKFQGRQNCGEGSDSEICCVCLSIMKEGDEMRILPCLHQFHRVCVDRWLRGCRKNCPMCRFSVGSDERFHTREAFTEEMVIWFSSFHVAGF